MCNHEETDYTPEQDFHMVTFLAHLYAGEGGQHRDAPLHGHCNGGVHAPCECDMDQWE